MPQNDANRLENVITYLEGIVTASTLLTEKFTSTLARSPVEAFSRAEAAMWQAARASVATTFLDQVKARMESHPETTAQEIIDSIKATATREAITATRHPERSTSVTSMIMNQQRATGFAEIAQDLEYY